MPKLTSRRTFTACWTCRQRNIRCDTKVPTCTQCARSHLRCEGYDLRLVWVDSETGQYEPQNRRAYPCELTWEGYRTWTIKEVGHLITFAETKRCRCRLHKFPSPFGKLDAGKAIPPLQLHQEAFEEAGIEALDSPRTDTPDTEPSCISESTTNTPDVSEDTELPDLSLSLLPSPRSLSTLWVPDGSREDNELFHHYVSSLAPAMTPIDDDYNPWKSTYPRLAIRGKASPGACSLFHAILAQSAFQWANLNQASSPKYLRVGTRNYVLALRHLRHSLNSPTENFTMNLAAMLTVTIAGHCFQGQSAGLDHHLRGAVRYVAQHLAQRPWTTSYDTWVVTQSFVLHTIISQTTGDAKSDAATTTAAATTTTNNNNTFNDTLDQVLEDVTTNPSFAYTVGCTPRLMKALYQARRLELELAAQRVPLLGEDDEDDDDEDDEHKGNPPPRLSVAQFVQASKILAELDAPLDADVELYLSRQRQQPRMARATAEQQRRQVIVTNLQLFSSAISIYLFRMVLRYPPSAVAEQVWSTLTKAAELQELGERIGAVSIWPIFVAAVEAYTPEAQALAETAWRGSAMLGAVNRTTAHYVVKRVWATREEIAQRRGCHVGDVALDWRRVLRKLDVHILLL